MSTLLYQLPLAITSTLVSMEWLIYQLFQSQGSEGSHTSNLAFQCAMLSYSTAFLNINHGNFYWESLQPLSAIVLDMSKYIILSIGLLSIKIFKVYKIPKLHYRAIQIFAICIGTLEVVETLYSPFNSLTTFRILSICWSLLYFVVGLVIIARRTKKTKGIAFQGVALIILASLELVLFSENVGNNEGWNSNIRLVITLYSLCLSIGLTSRQMIADKFTFHKLIKRLKLTLSYSVGIASNSMNLIVLFQMSNFVNSVQVLLISYMFTIMCMWFTFKSISEDRGRVEQELMVLANHLKVRPIAKGSKRYTIVFITVITEWAFLSCLPWVIAPLPSLVGSWVVTWPFKSSLLIFSMTVSPMYCVTLE